VENQSGLKVTANKVLIELLKVQEKTAGGIFIPQASQEKEQLAQQLGTVIDMGSTAKDYPEMEGIEIGDTVFFPRYRGAQFPVDGVDYWVMKAEDILGKATKLPDFVMKGADSSMQVFGANDYTLAA
jgi:chaperonin GroES